MPARSHLLLEADAVKLICPFLSHLERGHNPVTCIAGQCMAWREIDSINSVSQKCVVVGFCAAMSVPPQVMLDITMGAALDAARASGLIQNDS